MLYENQAAFLFYAAVINSYSTCTELIRSTVMEMINTKTDVRNGTNFGLMPNVCEYFLKEFVIDEHSKLLKKLKK